MTTWHDVADIEKQASHLVGEMKDAKGIIMAYREDHDAKAGRKCNCYECKRAEAWLIRNKE